MSVDLGAERDSPEERQGRTKTNDAECGHPFRREPAQMAALQNRRVKKPDAESANDLQTRQWLADKKATEKAQGVKSEAPPEKAGDGDEEIAQRRQVREDRMDLPRLELVVLHQIHNSGNAGESEGAVGN